MKNYMTSNTHEKEIPYANGNIEELSAFLAEFQTDTISLF